MNKKFVYEITEFSDKEIPDDKSLEEKLLEDWNVKAWMESNDIEAIKARMLLLFKDIHLLRRKQETTLTNRNDNAKWDSIEELCDLLIFTANQNSEAMELLKRNNSYALSYIIHKKYDKTNELGLFATNIAICEAKRVLKINFTQFDFLRPLSIRVKPGRRSYI